MWSRDGREESTAAAEGRNGREESTAAAGVRCGWARMRIGLGFDAAAAYKNDRGVEVWSASLGFGLRNRPKIFRVRLLPKGQIVNFFAFRPKNLGSKQGLGFGELSPPALSLCLFCFDATARGSE